MTNENWLFRVHRGFYYPVYGYYIKDSYSTTSIGKVSVFLWLKWIDVKFSRCWLIGYTEGVVDRCLAFWVDYSTNPNKSKRMMIYVCFLCRVTIFITYNYQN